MKYRLLLIPVILFFALLQSCDSQLDIAPENVLVEDKVFEEEGSAESAMAGLYFKVVESNKSGFGKAYSLGDLTTDILTFDEGLADKDFIDGTITPENTLSKDAWERYFSAINLANIFIERVPKIAKYSDDLKKIHVGEAKFLRAYCYFCLLKLFGDGALTGNEAGLCVPLQLTSYVGLDIDKYIPRNTNQEVFNQIITDLTQSIDGLPENYDDVNSSRQITVGRATVYAAHALLSRVYLYLGRYTDVLEAVKPFESTSQYELANLESVFPSTSSFSKDHIWGLDIYNSGGRDFGTSQFGSHGLYDYVYKYFSSELYQLYPNGDKRRDYLLYPISAGSTKYHSRKYAEENQFDNVAILRYAEVLLNKAEALANGGVNQTSVDILNDIRERAGLSGTNLYQLADFSTKEELLNAIWLERKLEFAGEGFERYDLIRTGRPLKNPNLPENKKVLPIPKEEIVITEGVIEQNEGYK